LFNKLIEVLKFYKNNSTLFTNFGRFIIYVSQVNVLE